MSQKVGLRMCSERACVTVDRGLGVEERRRQGRRRQGLGGNSSSSGGWTEDVRDWEGELEI